MKFTIAAWLLAQTLPVTTTSLLSEERSDNEGFFAPKKTLKETAAGSLSKPKSIDHPRNSRNLLKYAERRDLLFGNRGGAKPSSLLRNTHNFPFASSMVGVEDFEGQSCNPSSNDPDVGILSCGSGKICQPDANSFWGGTCRVQVEKPGKSFTPDGILKNAASATTANSGLGADAATRPLVECDPTALADVGILEDEQCGKGERCSPNEASSMGGFCESSRPPRHLISLLEQGATMCNPDHPNYMFYDCDCSGFDKVTGTGTIPCLGNELCLGFSYPGCTDLCLQPSSVYNFDNFTIPSYTFCLETITSDTPQSVCFYESFVYRTCTMEFNNQVCNSCNVTAPPDGYGYNPYYTTIDFDCTNVEGGSSGCACTYNLLPIINECYEPIENPVQCGLCPNENTGINVFYEDSLDRTLLDVDGYGTFSCWFLAGMSYIYGTIPESACPAVLDAGTALQCCSPICDICGSGPLNVYSSANFSGFEFPCYVWESYFADSPEACAAAKPYLVASCCGRDSPPTDPPITQQPTPPPTPTPTDGAASALLSGASAAAAVVGIGVAVAIAIDAA